MLLHNCDAQEKNEYTLQQKIESCFGELYIYMRYDEEGESFEVRRSDNYIHSRIYTRNLLKDQFHLAMSIIPALHACHNILILGAGCGVQCAQLINLIPFSRITAVDIDPSMLSLAERFLQKDIYAQVHWVEQDALEFCKMSKETYDCIIIDIYSDEYVPSFCLTQDFYKKLSERLAENGLMIFNTSIPDNPHQYGMNENNPLLQLVELIRNSDFLSIFYQNIFESTILYCFQEEISQDKMINILLSAWNEVKIKEVKCSISGLIMHLQYLEENEKRYTAIDYNSFYEAYIKYTKKVIKCWLTKACQNQNINNIQRENLNFLISSLRTEQDQIEALQYKYFQFIDALSCEMSLEEVKDCVKYISFHPVVFSLKEPLGKSQAFQRYVWQSVLFLRQDNINDACDLTNKVLESLQGEK